MFCIMKYIRFCSAAILLFLMTVVSVSAAVPSRIRENFDFDWQFRLGDTGEYAEVQLPHDWSIELDFDRSVGAAAGYLPGGIGWYRKTFFVPAAYRGKSVSLVFDGVYHQATVYLNGREIAYHRYGYTSFEVDLTEGLLYGQHNEIQVKVDRSEVSRWYTGSGIYRHVWLQVTSPVHVKMWGTYVTTPEVSEDAATVQVETTVQRRTADAARLTVEQYLLDDAGRPVRVGGQRAAAVSTLEFGEGETASAVQSFVIDRPDLWDLEHPYRYTRETVLKQGGREIDRYTTRFGVRSIRYDADHGFFLNGKHVRWQGVCLHQDAGCLGVAVPDRSYERRLQILKEFGVNAIRCSHNPPAPEFLDYCDAMGLLVLDEAFDKWKSGYYEKFFDDSWQDDIRAMLERDRNHPSVVLWSIGNEVAEAGRKDNVGVERAAMLQDFVHDVEPTRPVMLALQRGFADHFAEVTDVVGYNYMEHRMLLDKQRDPGRIVFISEAFPYYSGLRAYEVRDYVAINPWNYVIENEFILGSFIWAGVDYIGESMGWPSKGWSASPFDMTMYEKPRASYFRAVWNDRPSLDMYVIDYNLDEDPGKDHWQAPGMVRDWTFPYTDSRVLQIHTPSNCDEVVLYDAQGKQYGPRRPADYDNQTIVWNQPYRPGKILAVGYRGGVEVCRDSILTTQDQAASFRLTPDRTVLASDGQDLSHIALQLLDADGLPVRVDDRRVTVSVEGAGRLRGIDSGEMRRNERFTSPSLPTYFGRAQIVVQSARKAGTLTVHVEVEGLPGQSLTLQVK